MLRNIHPPTHTHTPNFVDLEKCCRTHIFLQNFVLVQPRTSPPKICKIFLPKFCKPRNFNLSRDTSRGPGVPDAAAAASARARAPARAGMPTRRVITKLVVEICGKFSAQFRSFSAVSAPIFARKYAFDSTFQNLPDFQAETFEIWQNFTNFATFAKFLLN